MTFANAINSCVGDRRQELLRQWRVYWKERLLSLGLVSLIRALPTKRMLTFAATMPHPGDYGTGQETYEDSCLMHTVRNPPPEGTQ